MRLQIPTRFARRASLRVEGDLRGASRKEGRKEAVTSGWRMVTRTAVPHACYPTYHEHDGLHHEQHTGRRERGIYVGLHLVVETHLQSPDPTRPKAIIRRVPRGFEPAVMEDNGA